MPPRTSEHHLGRARKMRREQTIAEEIVWRALRDRRLGLKFRRQAPVGAFIADFACIEAKVAVEVEGPSHEGDEAEARDAWRDRWFAADGWRVVRLPNALATGGGDLMLEPIRKALKEAVG